MRKEDGFDDPINLIAWLSTKPADNTYQFEGAQRCMLGDYYGGLAFFPERDRKKVIVIKGCKWIEVPYKLLAVAAQEPHTYGAALQRAATLLRGDGK